MEALKRLSLAVAVLALAGVGCGDDDDDDGPQNNNMDGGQDASIDSGAKPDATTPDSGQADAGATFSCTSGTVPTVNTCGGIHCEQSFAQLKASVGSSAKCSTDMELNQFCQLTSVGAVQTCLLSSLSAPDLAVATRSCTVAALPSYSAGCLDCFVAAGLCAATKCLAECSADPAGKACDTCRVTKGCISDFYTCTGIDNPLPGM